MKKLLLLSVSLCFATFSFSQSIQKPNSYGNGDTPVFGTQQFKAPGDSCGAYWNNYVGLGKSTQIYYEALRTGNASESGEYAGRAQRFHANQPIEVSGIQFYAFENNPAVDSIMAITVLNDYTPSNDSIGAQLAIDTCYVTAQNYSVSLPAMEVYSYFDTTVTVTDDYVITVYTPTDDSIKIIRNSHVNQDGNAEGVSFLLYDNPAYPSFTGYFNVYDNFGVNFDVDYLIAPRVKYNLHNGFNILDDEICPGVVGAGCVDYPQVANFNDIHYNMDAATPQGNIGWLWGDGFQNTDITTACHTYDTSGVYDIILKDTLRRYVYNNTNCNIELTDQITVIDSVFADFSYTSNDTWVYFTNNTINADSVSWDFGDSTSSTLTDPYHIYDSTGTFTVTLIAYNECFTDTTSMDITVDNLSIGDNEELILDVYPNPASNNATIRINTSASVEVLNILGETLMTKQLNTGNNEIGLSEFSSGTYFIRVSTDNNQVTKKLVVRH